MLNHFTTIFQLQKQLNLSKRPWKIILTNFFDKSNYYIHSVNTNTKQLIFNCKSYLHIKGCAMETNCTPSCSNIFMDHFKTKKNHLPIYQDIFIYIPLVSDNTFLILAGSFRKFLKQVNYKTPTN